MLAYSTVSVRISTADVAKLEAIMDRRQLGVSQAIRALIREAFALLDAAPPSKPKG